MNDIGQWLDENGLGKYADLFVENEIDFDVLGQITLDELEDLGIPLGARKRILNAVTARENPEMTATGDADAPGPTPSPRGEAERRQLTVMFCDLVGSVALGERMDVEDYRDLLARFRTAAVSAVEHFEGFVARHQGDGLLVYFGYPQAHEDDAERALRAGLAVIESIRMLALPNREPVAVRVGVATGPAVVGDLLETGASSELAALGQTPNLAARLQGAAGPDELLVSQTTCRLAGGGFAAHPTGPLELKGLEQPTIAYRVTGERPRDELQTRSEGPLVGRTVELALLLDRWAKTAEGAGQVVLLGAEPGLGKSRLLRELAHRLETQAHTAVAVHCSPYHSASAFYPVIEELNRLLDDQARHGQCPRPEALERWLALLGLERSRHAPILGRLLDVPLSPNEEVPDLSGPENHERTLESLTATLGAMARRQPVLLIGEDLHWIDPSTQALLGMTVELARSTRLMLLLTHRPEYSAPWSGEPHQTEIRLNHLTENECQTFVHHLLGEDVAPELRERIVERTDGVPLFVEELARAVSEGVTDAGAIPATLRDALTARLDRLGTARKIAQAAAVLGRGFPSDLVATVANRPPDDVAEALEALVISGLVNRIHGSDGADHQFKHALIRDTAYDSLLRGSREDMHRRAAHALAAKVPVRHELIAHHYEAAVSLQQADEHWVLAANAASERGAYEECEAHRRRALAVAESRPAPAAHLLDLTRQLAYILHLNGRRVQADELMNRQANLAAALDEPRIVARYHSTHGLIRSFLGQRAGARESQERALTLGRAAADPDTIIRALVGLGWEDVFVGHHRGGYERFREAAALLDSHAPRGARGPRESIGYEETGQGLCLQGLATCAANLGRFVEARRALARRQELTIPWVAGTQVDLIAGNWDRALTLINAELAADPPPFHEAVLVFNIGRAYLGRGDIDRAVDLLEQAREKARQYRSRQVQLWVALALTEAYLAAGRVDEAGELAANCLDEADRLGVSNARCRGQIGHVALRRGDLEQARACFESVYEHYLESGELPALAHTRVALARLAAANGTPEVARDHLQAAHQSYREMEMQFFVEKTENLVEKLGLEPIRTP